MSIAIPSIIHDIDPGDYLLSALLIRDQAKKNLRIATNIIVLALKKGGETAELAERVKRQMELAIKELE